MATRLTAHRPATLAGTFSFYASASDTATISSAPGLADALTVKGPTGPSAIRSLRASGWDMPVIFDRAGYDPKVAPVDPQQWFDEQSAAGADRLLSAGTWVDWDPTGETLVRAVKAETARCKGEQRATALLAVDHRWLTKEPMRLADALNSLERPTALVLAHQTDPLMPANAVQGLIAVTRTVGDLSLLRTDHGGFGALVYGASHASIGLIGSNRHFVPPTKSGGGIPGDRSPRLLVRPLLDWFTAVTIAGWYTEERSLRCPLACCGGRSLDRFFDPQFAKDAPAHNRLTLSSLADEILDPPVEERRQRFSQLCLDAVDRYGPMGKLSMVTQPKPQLGQWTFA